MKEIYTNELPKYNNKFNWKESVGYKVKGIYNDINFEIEIIDYIKINNKNYLKVKCNNKISQIAPGDFLLCKIGNVLNIITHQHKCQIGNIITDINSGKLEILEQIRIKNGKYMKKGYRYKCLICGNEDIISEGNLINNKNGCNVCSNQKVLVGINDMWTTNPDLAKLLLDFNDGYKYTQSSKKMVDWKCPDCSEIIKNKMICDINRQGLSCPKCSDKLPYPEKLAYNFLQQLNINFEYHKTFEWSKDIKHDNPKLSGNKQYDFYFELNDEKYALEANGLQHYQEGFKNFKGKTLKEEQENDRLKKELALQNGIKKENYIVIDCKKSELEWIKNSIIDSELSNIFDLSNIDWLKCEEFACNSLVKKVCTLWNKGIYNTIEIERIFKLGNSTIIKYLKQGTKLGWCDYNPMEEQRKGQIKNSGNCSKKKVICLNNDKVFNSIKEASKYYKINNSNIGECCKNKRLFTGESLKTKEYLQWQYYDEYLISPKKLLSNEEINEIHNNNRRIKIQKKIICLNNNEIFNTLIEATTKSDLKSNANIYACCKNQQRYAGINQETGEYLQWQYYKDYLIEPKKLLSNNEIDKIDNRIKLQKKVVCLNNKKIFNSIAEAGNYYKLQHSNIIKCCKNERNYTGKDPITNEKLHWMYYDEYIIQKQKKEIS